MSYHTDQLLGPKRPIVTRPETESTSEVPQAISSRVRVFRLNLPMLEISVRATEAAQAAESPIAKNDMFNPSHIAGQAIVAAQAAEARVSADTAYNPSAPVPEHMVNLFDEDDAGTWVEPQLDSLSAMVRDLAAVSPIDPAADYSANVGAASQDTAVNAASQVFEDLVSRSAGSIQTENVLGKTEFHDTPHATNDQFAEAA